MNDETLIEKLHETNWVAWKGGVKWRKGNVLLYPDDAWKVQCLLEEHKKAATVEAAMFVLKYDKDEGDYDNIAERAATALLKTVKP